MLGHQQAVVAMHPVHTKDEPVPDDPELDKDDSRPWILRSPRSREMSVLRIILTIVIPILTMMLVAIVLGLALNKKYTGSFTGKTGEIKAASEKSSSSGTLSMDALSSACASAAVVAAMSLVRFIVRTYLHPRMYGVFSFTVYMILTCVLLWKIFSGQITCITNPAANGFVTQIYTFLEDRFNHEDSAFATTFKDIGSFADYWNWMKGPLRTFIVAQNTNVARLGSEPINAPAMIPVRNSNQNLYMYPWIVSWCTFRTLGTAREPKIVSSYLGARQANHIIPEFSKSKYNPITTMGFLIDRWKFLYKYELFSLPSTYTNAFGEELEAWREGRVGEREAHSDAVRNATLATVW